MRGCITLSSRLPEKAADGDGRVFRSHDHGAAIKTGLGGSRGLTLPGMMELPGWSPGVRSLQSAAGTEEATANLRGSS